MCEKCSGSVSFYPGGKGSSTSSAGITRIRFKGFYLRLVTTPVNINNNYTKDDRQSENPGLLEYL